MAWKKCCGPQNPVLIWKIMILFSDAPHTVDTCYIIIIMFQAPFVSTVSPSVWKMWTSHSVCRNAKLRKFQHGHSSVCSAPGERLQAFLDQRFRSRWSGTLFIFSPQSSVSVVSNNTLRTHSYHKQTTTFCLGSY